MTMTNEKIISEFMSGSFYLRGKRSMSIRKWFIYSYAVPIATIYEKALHINVEKYASTTTTKLQNELQRRTKRVGRETITYTEKEFKDTFKL